MLGQVLLYHAAIPPSDSGGSRKFSPLVLRPGQGIADGDYDDQLRDPTAAFSLVPRNRSRLSAWNEPPDEGTFPKVVIAGMGKCGTNALAEALARLGFDDPSLTNVWVQDDEIQRQGFSGEVNWQCGKFATHEGLAEYRRLFSPEKANWMDKSTSYMSCAHNVSSSMPNTAFFVMLCDPVMAIWSRMNHLRDQNISSSDPDQIMRVIDAKQKSPPQRNCDVITRYDMSLRPQLEVCYQLDAGLRYAEQVGEWLREAPGRVRFIISEASDADPKYMINQAASFLGKAPPDNSWVGSVHSHHGEASYLEPRGPQWDSYLSVILPLLRPVMQEVNNLAASHDGMFGGQKVFSWWPSMGNGVWTENQKPQAESQGQQAGSQRLQAGSQKQKAGSQKQKAESQKQQPMDDAENRPGWTSVGEGVWTKDQKQKESQKQQHMDGSENHPDRQRRRQQRREERREEARGEGGGEGKSEGGGKGGEAVGVASREVAAEARAELTGQRAAKAKRRGGGDARVEAVMRIEATAAAAEAEAEEAEARQEAEASLQALASFRPALVRIGAAPPPAAKEATSQAAATVATAAAAAATPAATTATTATAAAEEARPWWSTRIPA